MLRCEPPAVTLPLPSPAGTHDLEHNGVSGGSSLGPAEEGSLNVETSLKRFPVLFLTVLTEACVNIALRF